MSQPFLIINPFKLGQMFLIMNPFKLGQTFLVINLFKLGQMFLFINPFKAESNVFHNEFIPPFILFISSNLFAMVIEV